MPPGGPPMPPGAIPPGMPPQHPMPAPAPPPMQQPVAAAGFATDQNIQQNFMAALAIIKDPTKRKFRIDIESDSMINIDEQQEKQARSEFLTASGTFLENGLSALAKVPPQLAAPLVPLFMEMLLFGVRGFKAGRDMETTFETAKAQILAAIQQAQQSPPPPDPNAAKAEADLKLGQEKNANDLTLGREKIAAEAQLEREKLSAQSQTEQARIASDAQTAQHATETHALTAPDAATGAAPIAAMLQQLQAATQAIVLAAQQMAKPVMLHKDATGRTIGASRVDQLPQPGMMN